MGVCSNLFGRVKVYFSGFLGILTIFLGGNAFLGGYFAYFRGFL